MTRATWIPILLLAISFDVSCARNDGIAADERVIFFPTAGYWDAERQVWVLPIHGWVFEPEQEDLIRNLTLRDFRQALDLKPGEEDTVRFEAVARAFLVDNERGKRIRIRLGDKEYLLGPSEPDGHFRQILELSGSDVENLRGKVAPKNWLSYEMLTLPKDPRKVMGKIQLLSHSAPLVVSDIDDTIKITEVADPARLLSNTFLREFRAVPGMSAIYRQWEDAGATFYYLSDSPWQLYEPLSEFLRREKFPEGSFRLKAFRWKDASFVELFTSPLERKLDALEAMLRDYTSREFILVGDTGQKDPEVFATFARKYPDRIARVYLRNTTNEAADGERLRRCFEGVEAVRWQLFTDPKDIRPIAGAGK